MANNFKHAYDQEITRQLELFQFIEDILKESLKTAFEISKLSGQPEILIGLEISKLKSFALGKLVPLFAHVNPDQELQKNLRNIIKHRNHLAHESYVLTLGELTDHEFMTSRIGELKAVNERAQDIHHQILNIRWGLVRDFRRIKRTLTRNI